MKDWHLKAIPSYQIFLRFSPFSSVELQVHKLGFLRFEQFSSEVLYRPVKANV